MRLAIIDYGAGNVFSVKSAFERLGLQPVLSANEEQIRSSDLVVFPGVGHAQSAMTQLKATGLDKVIPTLKQPVLGVCLGMQLMCDATEEGDTTGLGIFNGVNVIRFDDQLKVPHMGWNELENSKGTLTGINEAVYFVHSYYAPLSEATIAECLYPFAFSAALEKDNFMACQFHPEKSGKAGEEVLKRFLNKGI